MNPEERAFRRLASRLYWGEADEREFSRPIIVTPFGGHYGRVAGYVVTINGSPPKGTFVVSGTDPVANPHVVLVAHGKSRTLPWDPDAERSQYRIVMDFLESVTPSGPGVYTVDALDRDPRFLDDSRSVLATPITIPREDR